MQVLSIIRITRSSVAWYEVDTRQESCCRVVSVKFYMTLKCGVKKGLKISRRLGSVRGWKLCWVYPIDMYQPGL